MAILEKEKDPTAQSQALQVPNVLQTDRQGRNTFDHMFEIDLIHSLVCKSMFRWNLLFSQAHKSYIFRQGSWTSSSSQSKVDKEVYKVM